MGKLKYTSDGVVVQNELTITGSDGTSVNVKEKLDKVGDPIVYEGEFYANDCLTPGIYQYIVTGRTGLDTTNDDHYSLFVMKTDSDTIRQIAFGSKLHSNIYSRVCVNGDWDDEASNVNFQKIGNIGTINLTLDADITAKHKLIDALGLTELYITDNNGMYPGEGTITVTSANMKLLQDTLAEENEAISAFMSNWQAYYKIGLIWYSQTVSSYVASKTGTFKVGDKLKLYKKTTSIAEYFKQIIDWKNIDVQSKMSEYEQKIWQGMMENYGASTDGECILAMINAGDIYSAKEEPNKGGDTYSLKGSNPVTIYDYMVIEPEDNRQNICSAAINDYKKTVAGNNWQTLIGSSDTTQADLLEVYAGYNSLDQTEFHLCLPLTYCQMNSILKLRCFYRKGELNEGATTYKYDSDAYMYVSNSTDLIPRGHDGIGDSTLMSDYVPVRSIGSFEMLPKNTSLGRYPDNRPEVRTYFFNDMWDYGYQYLKINTPTAGTLYLHIYGTFDTIRSWFCLDYKDIQCYVPCDKIGDLSQLETTCKTEVVGAINEVNSAVSSKADQTDIDQKVGDLTLLETSAKDNAVVAINEVFDEISKINELIPVDASVDNQLVDREYVDASISAISENVGDVSLLETSVKTDLVSAVNEVNKTKQNTLTPGSHIAIENNEISAKITLDSNLEYSDVSLETSGKTVDEAMTMLLKEVVDDEKTAAASLYDLKTEADANSSKADEIYQLLKSMTYVAVTFDVKPLHMNNKFDFSEQGYETVYDNNGNDVLTSAPEEKGIYFTKLGEVFFPDGDFNQFNRLSIESYQDIDVDSSLILGTDEPAFVIFPDTEEGDMTFEFFITVDSKVKYRINNVGSSEFRRTLIDDSLIEFLKSSYSNISDEFLAYVESFKNSDWYCAMSSKAHNDYGFTYSGKTYYWTDNSKQYGSGPNLFGYDSEDGTDTIWTVQNIYKCGADEDAGSTPEYSDGQQLAVARYSYDAETMTPTYMYDIDVVVKKRYK